MSESALRAANYRANNAEARLSEIQAAVDDYEKALANHENVELAASRFVESVIDTMKAKFADGRRAR